MTKSPALNVLIKSFFIATGYLHSCCSNLLDRYPNKNSKLQAGISIAGYNETEIPILMNKTGRGLTMLLHKKVVIKGRKIKTDNIDVIEVQKFGKDSI